LLIVDRDDGFRMAEVKEPSLRLPVSFEPASRCGCIRKSNAATEILIATQFVAVAVAAATAIAVAVAPELWQLKLMA